MTPEDLMKRVAEGIGQADWRPFLEALHHEIVWKSASRANEPFVFGGDYRNVQGVQEVMSKLLTNYVYRRFDAKEIVAKGDAVWGLFDVEVDYVPSLANSLRPQSIGIEMALRWRLKDGKIIEHQAFFDTASFFAKQCAAMGTA